MYKSLRLFSLFLIILALVFAIPATAEQAKKEINKRPLTHDDYDSWKSIVRQQISVDGKWILYLETPQDGEADIVVKNIKTGKEYRHTIGYSGEGTDSEREANSKFTYDSTHVVFLISPSKQKSKKPKKPRKKRRKKRRRTQRIPRNDLESWILLMAK